MFGAVWVWKVLCGFERILYNSPYINNTKVRAKWSKSGNCHYSFPPQVGSVASSPVEVPLTTWHEQGVPIHTLEECEKSMMHSLVNTNQHLAQITVKHLLNHQHVSWYKFGKSNQTSKGQSIEHQGSKTPICINTKTHTSKASERKVTVRCISTTVCRDRWLSCLTRQQ